MHSNDAQMLVLTVLADGPLHGYAINTAIEELTGRKLGPGSLYGALSRLEARELIRPATRRPRRRSGTARCGSPTRAATRCAPNWSRWPASPRPACARSGSLRHERGRAHRPGSTRPPYASDGARRSAARCPRPGIRSWPDTARRGRTALAAPERLARDARRPDPPRPGRRAVRGHRRRRRCCCAPPCRPTTLTADARHPVTSLWLAPLAARRRARPRRFRRCGGAPCAGWRRGGPHPGRPGRRGRAPCLWPRSGMADQATGPRRRRPGRLLLGHARVHRAAPVHARRPRRPGPLTCRRRAGCPPPCCSGAGWPSPRARASLAAHPDRTRRRSSP